MGRHWGKDVAAMKGSAYRVVPESGIGNLHGQNPGRQCHRTCFRGGPSWRGRGTVDDVAQYPIVRGNEKSPLGFQDDGSALAAHPRVNDDRMDGVFREIAVDSTQDEGCLLDVLRLNEVRNVNDDGIGVDAQDDTLQGCHIGVPKAKVGGESDRLHSPPINAT